MRENERSPFPLDGGRAGEGGDPAAGSAPRPTPAPGAVARARRLREDMTLPERLLWKALRALKLNVRRQAPIGRFVVDFVHHESRLVIEVDGPHHDSPEAQAADAARTAWLEGQGYRVRRYPAKRVINDWAAVAEEIRSEIGSPPSQPFPHQGGRALWRARHQWVREN